MSDSTSLDIAAEGDILDTSGIQDSIDDLLAIADSLNALKDNAETVADVQLLGQTQEALVEMSQDLADKQIALVAGQVKVTADHVNAATAAAMEVISETADMQKKVRKITGLLDFCAAVITGDGGAILQAAVALKTTLDG